MKRNLLRNLAVFVCSVFLLSCLVFGMSRLAPGDPLVSYYGDRAERMNPEEKKHARHRLGLDQPVTVQYVKWVKNLAAGDFGISYKYKRPVIDVVSGRLVHTLLLGGTGFILTFLLALLLGIFCAIHEGEWVDRLVCRVGTISSCIPDFWLSLVLIMIFSVHLNLLPASGAYDLGKASDLLSRIRHILLPLCAVILGHLWYYGYMLRNRLLDEVHKDYVLLFCSAGMPKKRVIARHCVRNIMPTYLSIMALSLPHVIEGTYIVEMVFSYPGIGTLSFESAKYHDYHLLMFLCLVTGTFVILGNMTGQWISERIDPRMRGMLQQRGYQGGISPDAAAFEREEKEG